MTRGGADRDRSLTPGAQLTLFCDAPVWTRWRQQQWQGWRESGEGGAALSWCSVRTSASSGQLTSWGSVLTVASGHTELPEQCRVTTLAVLTLGEPEEWSRTEINLP